MRLKFDWFLAGMMVAVALAWRFPDPGARGGWLHPEWVTKLGVALIFFLHGATLSFSAFKTGTLRWPLHLVVQGTTYGLFPLLGLGLIAIAGPWMGKDLALGFFFLCALPSTVSSSAAMTAVARGNVPVAVFNATLSSLLGVFLTPLWIGWKVEGGGRPVPLGPVMIDLFLWLILPLIVGQLSRPIWGAFATRNKKRIGVIDRFTIFVLVYTSFCDSVKDGVWTGHGVAVLVVTLVGSVALFGLVFTILGLVCDALGFPTEDRIAAVFCGSKKTLASGVPMASLIFGASPALGLILLPLLIYHPLQLFICTALAGRWAAREDDAATTPVVTVAGK